MNRNSLIISVFFAYKIFQRLKDDIFKKLFSAVLTVEFFSGHFLAVK